MVINTIFNSIQLYRGGQYTCPSFTGVLLTSTPHNIPSKPLAAFSQNHRDITEILLKAA